MADYQSPAAGHGSTGKTKSKNKRKVSSSEKHHEEKAPKSSRIDRSDGFMSEPTEDDKEKSMELLEDSTPWRNLQLVLSLQKKSVDIEKKVELAYKFVKLSVSEVADDTTQYSEVVSFARVVIFLNNWIQSTLISSEKTIRVEGIKPRFGSGGSCLDYRCWKIFKFCLEEGLKRHVSLSFSRDLLRVIHCIARNLEIKDLDDDEFMLYDNILDCISSVFKSHGGVSNENLDLWVSMVGTILELVLKVITGKLDGTRAGTIILNLTCLLLEPFSMFLRLHPNRKNGFHDFVDRLLEPLLCLLDVLSPVSDVGYPGWMSKLLKLVEEALSQGLFHHSHIDGFLSLQSLAKYKTSDDGKPNSKTIVKSYHRHLFDKIGRLVAEKKALALGGEGQLFRLYVHCLKRQEGVEAIVGSREFVDDHSGQTLKRSSISHNLTSEKSHCVSGLSAEIRKSLFDFFVYLMEPLLGEIDTYLRDEVEVGHVLEDVHSTLKSTNGILFSLMHEKVYVKVDDTSEGACANFLKLVCDKITSLSAKVNQLLPSTFELNSGIDKELVKAIAKELVVSIRHLLEIEYEVLGNDLESLWLLMFSYGTLGNTSTDLQDQSTLILEIINLGCQVVNLYSELRQVGTSVFTLCKAIRSLVSSVRDVGMSHSEPASSRSSLFHASWIKSLRSLLCSRELRFSIHSAVKSIPEGQVSLCIRELATDLSESLKWMKENPYTNGSGSPCFNFQTEVFGIGLSEVYALLLESLMVTAGNSTLVGVSLNALMALIRPSMSVLVSQPKNGVYGFLSMVSGREFSNQPECKFSALWFFLFFFRLYLSCRSLYRQVISLAPPTTSKKMSEEMHDPFTAYSGNNWLEKKQGNEGYFSWIVQPSASLPLVIEAILGISLTESIADSPPLTYMLNAMALQRLVDLNRLLKSFEFLLKRNDMMINKEDDAWRKQDKRWRKHVSKLAEEAKDLTDFITGHLSLLKKGLRNYYSVEDGWDLGVAGIDNKSLPCAFWSIVCLNVDIWSTHADKKKLKTFISLLLQTSFSYPHNDPKQVEDHNGGKAGYLKTVTAQETSLELLSDTVFYEEKFVHRHMASRFCRFLEESVTLLFSSGIDVKLQAPPDWSEVLDSLERSLVLPPEASNSHSIRKSCNKEVVPSTTMKYSLCQNLLNFLCWMPRRCISSKSFSLYATCIFNLERLIVDTLLGNNDDAHLHNCNGLLQLFLCCRKTLKHLTETLQNSLGPLHFGANFPASWLLKSLFSVHHAFSKDGYTQVNQLMFSLMDYTSYVFLTLVKGSFIHASESLVSSKEHRRQKAKSTNSESTSSLDPSESIDACNFMIHVAETLKDHTQTGRFRSAESGAYDFQKLSSITACIQGFLWGISSALCHMDAQSNKLKPVFFSRHIDHPLGKLKLCIDAYASFINEFLRALVLEDDKLPKSSSDSSSVVSRDGFSMEKSLNLEDVDTGGVCITKDFLRSLLAGENLEAAFLLRQQFIAYSAVLRLNLQIKTSLSSSLVHIFIEISEILLLEFANKAETPSRFTFVFLDGIGKFLEEMGNHFPLTDPTFSTKFHARLVDLHLKAIGKCISLQGKRATLESHETESSTKTINGPLGFSGCMHSDSSSSLDELKNRLRLSFKVLIGKHSDSHFSSAIQSINKALVGGCIRNYQIYTGNSGGGKVSSTVAAGVDCFDSVLEIISGRKISSAVKADVLGLVGCLFNIIPHLQGPRIFHRDPVYCAEPDPGSVVLMCLEVLAKVSGKHALYQMDTCHVAHALSIPAALFQTILRPTPPSRLDRQFSVELYGACCRMLYTFLRHHKRETLQHVALLQTSVSVLLHCLETVKSEQAHEKTRFVWEVQEGVKCASFLRRIYEEIRQQKDALGQDCRLFLSSYIMVYSRYGPLKVGIIREIDEALRPGIYALIDACSPDDLQYIHTVLGEGPCRNTLANLQHDYKLNFQYEGKV